MKNYKMKNKILNIVITIFGLSIINGAQASYVIDDFSNSTGVISAGALNSKTTSPLSGSVFSDSRFLEINKPRNIRGVISTFVDNERLVINTGAKTGADTKSSYYNASGFDFTANEVDKTSYHNAFVLSLLSIDQGGVDVTLTVDGVSSKQFVNAVSDVVFSHTLFDNLADVNSIELFIHNNKAVDATFDSLASFGGAPTTVPLPGSLLFLTSGIAVLGFARRKER